MSRRQQDPQAALKSRLKKLYTLPANQVCADCPERSPRWVTIIKIPPGQQNCELFNTNGAAHTAGCFMCLECSGSHRRLGVHIGFVRSVNLDSWKEEEVLALERSGSNAKVNHYYMAEHPGQQKQGPVGPDGKASRFLSQSANGSERERFIREKYDKRRWFNPNGSSGQTFVQPAAAPAPQRTGGGTTSQAARERAAKMRQQNAHARAPAPAPAPAPPPAAAPVVDLLDFSASPVPAPAPAPAQQPQQDLFAAQPPAAPQQNGGFDAGFDAFAGGGGFQQAPAAQPAQVQQNGFGTDPFGQPQQPAPTPQQQQQQQQQQPQQQPEPPKASADAILSMYSAPQQNGMAADPFGAMGMGGGGMGGGGMGGGGMAANGMNMGGMGMMGGGNPQQQQQQMLMMRQQQQAMQMQQQRMMMQGGGMNGGMGGMGGMGMGMNGGMQPHQQMSGNVGAPMNNGMMNGMSMGAPMNGGGGFGMQQNNMQGFGGMPQQQQQQQQPPQQQNPFGGFGGF
ncbi:hypothetical protein TrVE_jg5372 [Triparma verrucosa]|uniref:Arf-GAP domain-containing protein n=1 Tax=Triparma verrucosa TaxID=1606542 RepID=A0A9W7B0Y6_9STRA|nr:hypothetical protein TrVE_jg5372 [Triparma verrucosa]